MSTQPSAWELNACKVIGSLLANEKIEFEKAVYGTGLKFMDMPPIGHYRDAMVAMLDAFEKKEPITTDVVWAYSGRQVPREWLDETFYNYRCYEEELVAAARAVIRYSERARNLKDLEMAIQGLRDETQDPTKVIQHLSRSLASVRGVEIQSPCSRDIIERIRQKAQNGVQTQLASVSLPWFNAQLRGGFKSKRYIAIGAREKGRKFSLLRNLLLATCRRPVRWELLGNGRKMPIYEPANVNVALLAFENDQEITTWDFIAMLAFEYLYYTGYVDLSAQEGRSIAEAMNGEDIQNAFETGKWRMWSSKHMRDAVTYGVKQFEMINLAIYDSSQENGGLRSLDDMRRVIKLHHNTRVQPGQHPFYCIDYGQLVKQHNDLFQDMRDFSSECRYTADTRNATVIALSQFNRETNKMNARKEDTGDVMGTRGGADLEQDCNNYFEVLYDAERKPDELTVRQRRARRGASGRNNSRVFWIHAPSGYIPSVCPADKGLQIRGDQQLDRTTNDCSV